MPAARLGGGGVGIRFLQRRMTSWHRRKGDSLAGMALLYLTTIGARSGRSVRGQSPASPAGTARRSS